MKACYADSNGKVHTYAVQVVEAHPADHRGELGLGVAERALDDAPDVRRLEQRSTGSWSA